MTSLVFLLYAFSHLALFGWALLLLLRYRHVSTVPLLLVTFGLVYDNAILAGGNLVGHGDLLERLSVPRFFMHAFVSPLLMLSALGFMRRSNAKWSQSTTLAASVAALTLVMVVLGVEADLVRLDLDAKRAGDVVSYGNAASAGPPVPALVTVAVLIAAGAFLWRQEGMPWLFLGAVFQFVAAALGDAIVIAGNLGELALLGGLLVTDSQLSRQTRLSQVATQP